MKKKYFRVFFLILIFFCLVYFIYFKFLKKEQKLNVDENELIEKEIYNSNIMKDVKYTSKDSSGNQYTITASTGEIDLSNSNIIFLTNVKAIIKLENNNTVYISSEFGKYNTDNLDTIFSKNVIIEYLENNIIGEYLDFSPNRNSMIISRNITYTNPKNILKADVIEIDLITKDTKIYMYEDKKKVRIKSKN